MIYNFVKLSATFLGGRYFAKVVIEEQIWIFKGRLGRDEQTRPSNSDSGLYKTS